MTPMTPERRKIAEQMLQENFDAERAYNLTPHGHTADMLVIKAERNLDLACRVLGYTVERRDLGYKIVDARTVVLMDVGAIRNRVRKMVAS